ncbi:hypothetical protein TBLA_0D04930 [Henningerozyma blattae CBS 6284]|uniref:Tyrosine-protein phosphatase CDC14 n=1 Tax=Henningerozyma blattae (strain ATCC 34711 / CBS 6284 / DSM 70876 / NBRC 10599 / NRRL Y-10934 / UCD 77-7) TaxID=1071380 RepID=I2H3N6_HENB6|nr:hypothetical protein TBLA_0D04930 [Tetrapisispora blattae CBS 6284]CCH60988.1 hypothetical protein TBLA_0D04930 [Tetrapisispora blattae CBS 6284]
MGKSIQLDNTIEFLKGRVYLGAYDYTPQDASDMVFFTIEDSIFYNSFHLDFGPMNIAHLYRFAVIFHEILNDPENTNKAVIFYSSTSTRQRANSACLLCCYMVLVQGWTPHQVLQPLAQVDPPFMPFRDAGYSNADFEITIQDVVYGVWRAKEKSLINLQSFNLETYERYERVEFGDFNVLTPDFIAFASPQENTRLIGGSIENAKQHLNQPFKSVLKFFNNNNVQLVVRLNSHLYNKEHFEEIGIKHVDMIFEDGSCPDMSIVHNFVGAAETIINRGGKVAVHCKAGLGRTGCLIGAHLIYTYGFTANECIGFLRFIRPGMVVGPQQHWLYLHQNDFREWKYTMRLSLEPSHIIGGLYPLVTVSEYRLQKENKLKQKKKQKLEHQDKDRYNQSKEDHSSNNKEMDESTNNDNEKYDSDVMTPPSSKPSKRRQDNRVDIDFNHSAAVPQQSPGQPRKGFNGARTTEDIAISKNIDDYKTNTPSSHNDNSIVANSSDDVLMQDDIEENGKYKHNKHSFVEDANKSAEETIRQMLPRNRRPVANKRNISSSGGVRKISGTSRK